MYDEGRLIPAGWKGEVHNGPSFGGAEQNPVQQLKRRDKGPPAATLSTWKGKA